MTPTTSACRFLQLMSEGPSRRPRPDARSRHGKPINLLNEFVTSSTRCRRRSRAAGRCNGVSDVILEVIQARKDNQDHFARSTELIEIMMRVLRESPTGDCEQDEDDDVKQCFLEVFEGLTEGQGKPSRSRQDPVGAGPGRAVAAYPDGRRKRRADGHPDRGLGAAADVHGLRPRDRVAGAAAARIRAQMNKEVISVEVVWNGSSSDASSPCLHLPAHR